VTDYPIRMMKIKSRMGKGGSANRQGDSFVFTVVRWNHGFRPEGVDKFPKRSDIPEDIRLAMLAWLTGEDRD
jgi:hypothetical protein